MKTNLKIAKTPALPPEFPTVAWELIGPHEASTMLLNNDKNRPLKLKKIREYSMAMQEERWKRTGLTIQVGKSGRLVDGQNRLQAIVDAGKAVWMIVVRGVDEAIFDVIDSGQGRTGADTLIVEGVKAYCQLTAASAQLIRKIEDNVPHDPNMPNDVMRKFVVARERIAESVAFVKGMQIEQAKMPQRYLAAIHYFMAEKDQQLATEFFEQVFSGTHLDLDSMQYLLRQKIIDLYKPRWTRAHKDAGAAAGTIKVWNALRAGETIKVNGALLWPNEDGSLPDIQ